MGGAASPLSPVEFGSDIHGFYHGSLNNNLFYILPSSPVVTTKFIALDALNFLVNFSPATRQILNQNLSLVGLHSVRHQIAAGNYHGFRSNVESGVHENLLASVDHTIAIIDPDIPSLGVTLLSPRNKRLRDQIYCGTDDFTVPLTEEERRKWKEAFETLINYLLYVAF